MPISEQPTEAMVSDVRCDDAKLTVDLSDGRTIIVPIDWYPRLEKGSPEQRANWELIGHGVGIHWTDLNEDLSVEGLLRGARAPRAQ